MQILSNEVSDNVDMDIFNMFLIFYKILKYHLTSRDIPRWIPKTIVALCRIDNIRYSTHFTFLRNMLNNILNKTIFSTIFVLLSVCVITNSFVYIARTLRGHREHVSIFKIRQTRRARCGQKGRPLSRRGRS